MVFVRDSSEGTIVSARRGRSRSHITAATFLVTAFFLAIYAANAGDLDKVVVFNIEAQTLDKALLEFGAQAHVQIMYAWDSATARLRTEGLKGDYTGREALRKLLKGTPLYFVEQGNTIAIVSNVVPPPTRPVAVAGGSDPPTSHVLDPQGADDPIVTHQDKNGKAGRATRVLQEVIVTGTHIRGTPPQSVPLLVFTRSDIENSGYPTLEEFMDSIPENFGGVSNGAVSTPQNGLAGNLAFGTAVDLLGLGAESTLVLVNGHRLAPAGIGGSFTDISLIPLSAIERIDIEPAGASAVYGSDAVGGVVNYILRSPREPTAESTLEYGGVTNGGLTDLRATQMLSTAWSTGSGFLSYEYNDETPLPAEARPYSQHSLLDDLVPETRQYGVLGNVTQGLGSDLKLLSDVFYAERHSYAPVSSSVGLPVTQEEADTKEYQVAVEIQGAALKTWTWNSRLSLGGNTTIEAGNEGIAVPYGNRGDSRLATFDLGASGALGTLFSEPVLAAAGAQVRDEQITSEYTGANATIVPIARGRTVDSAFAEAKIPLLGSLEGQIKGPPRAELDIAGRYEHYTDFGSESNPSIGLAVWPLQSVRLRASWSSSFSAPELWQLYGGQYSLLLNVPNARSASLSSPVLELIGTNPNLTPETSTQWTAGVDITPELIRPLLLRLSYYRIDYKDRISTPNIPVLDPLGAGSQYAPFIHLNPSISELDALSSSPYDFLNETSFPGFGPPALPTEAVAVADDSLTNIAATFTDGLNMDVQYSGDAYGYRVSAALNGAYVLAFRESPLPTAEAVEVLNTLFNPLKLRARGTIGEGRGPESVHVSLNYSNRYANISSWTTLDVVARYSFSGDAPLGPVAHGLEVSLACTNCTDRPPPRVTSLLDTLGRGYDPTNANPLGRFLSVTLTKRW